MPSTRTTSKTKRSSRKRTSSSKAGKRSSRAKKTARGGKKRTTRGAKTATAARKRTAARKTKAKAKKAAAKKAQAKRPAKKTPSKANRAKKKVKPARKTTSASRKAKKTSSRSKAAPAKAAPPKAAPKPAPKAKAAPLRSPYGEGAHVVHPKYGLGRVERIVDRSLTTRTVRCLEIRFPYQEMKLTIPIDQVDNSGLRPPIGRRDIDGVFKVLKGRATFDANRRSAKRVMDYRKRLSEGDPTSLAEAVRDLGRLSLRKALSYEERRILSTALRILSREVALARGREAEDVREEIEKIVYR